jgi:hypothetical protein
MKIDFRENAKTKLFISTLAEPEHLLCTYSYCIKILFFLPANSPWLRLVLVRPDLSSTDSRT